MKTIEIKAATVEDAIEKGLAELGKKQDEVDIDIADIGGFLKKAKVILTVKPAEIDNALEFVKNLLKKMEFDITVEATENEDKIILNLSGKDSGKIIGYRGDVLDAVQYITSVSVNNRQDDYKKIIVDCENYRSKREETLISLAGKLAQKAEEKGRKISLEPMNPFERRIIHAALQDNENVTTESEGIDPNRYIVIKPKNYKYGNSRDDRKGYEGRQRNDRPYNRDNRDRSSDSRQKSGFGGNSRSKSSSFNGFGSYLGNSKSGFGSDNNFTKKSGFDNLKD